MPEISKEELVEEVRNLMELDEDELYARLGYQSLGLEGKPTELQLLDQFSISKLDLIVRGRAFFDRNKQRLREKICDEWGYCKKRGEYTGDFGFLMVALVPVVARGLGLPTYLIAVLCTLAFKYGLNKLCECDVL
jgi:hypothetical protein